MAKIVTADYNLEPEHPALDNMSADGTIDKIISFDEKISGEDILQGFELDLSILK